MLLAGIQAGMPRPYGMEGRPPWRSGYAKSPIRGSVRVRRENLDGDGQADLRHHAGPDMAVLAYPQEHYARWRDELRWPDVPYGAFGENFTVAGVTEEDACLGDVWRVGSALLQISQPRKPCRNISRFWHRPELLRLVQRTGRYGFYLRVLEEGIVDPSGDGPMMPTGAATLVPLRIGCTGLVGGGPTKVPGGAAGGAIELSAKHQVTLDGALYA